MDERDVVMDYQIESQRGMSLLGKQKFTATTLLPCDPRPYTTLDGKPLGNSLNSLEVPDDSWVWTWPQWYVDMTPDVDDHGWSYSWRFSSKHWRETNRMYRSFVRQRVWKRPRVKLSKTTQTKANDQVLERSPTSHKLTIPQTGIFIALESARNDRERVTVIVDYVTAHPDELKALVQSKSQIIGQLAFPISQHVLADKLAAKAAEGHESCRIFLLAPPENWWTRAFQRGEPDSMAGLSYGDIDDSDEGPGHSMGAS